jgi:hypothetical protein
MTCGFEADCSSRLATYIGYSVNELRADEATSSLSISLSRSQYTDTLRTFAHGNSFRLSVCVPGVGVDVVTRILKVKRLSSASETAKASFLMTVKLALNSR